MKLKKKVAYHGHVSIATKLQQLWSPEGVGLLSPKLYVDVPAGPG